MNTIASKRWIRLSSDLVRTLEVTVGRILLTLLNVGFVIFYRSKKKKNSWTLRPLESNSIKCSSTVHSTELNFSMYIIGHRPPYCIDFSEFRINSFFF